MSKKREHHKLFMVGSDAPFQFTEAYKSLRTNLEFLAATSDCKTILITSSVPGEGKSNVAVNLAITLADSGKRVVLVDCDMRKSTISRYLHIPRDHIGITNTITGKDRTQLANALVNFKDLGIVVLPVGTIPPNPSELLATKAMENTFEALKQVYDYIIVDTPPVSVVTDAAVLCKYVDGALLVVRPGVTTIEGAQLSKKNLEAVNARVLGVVMNGYDVKKAGKKDGYYYSYSYGYSNDDAAGTMAWEIYLRGQCTYHRNGARGCRVPLYSEPCGHGAAGRRSPFAVQPQAGVCCCAARYGAGFDEAGFGGQRRKRLAALFLWFYPGNVAVAAQKGGRALPWCCDFRYDVATVPRDDPAGGRSGGSGNQRNKAGLCVGWPWCPQTGTLDGRP